MRRQAGVRRTALAAAVVASLLAHVAIVWWAPAPDPSRRAAPPEPTLVELSLAVDEAPAPPAQPDPLEPSEAVAAAAPPTATARPRRERRSRRGATPRTPVTVDEPAGDAVAVVVEPAAPEVETAEPERPAICDVLAEPERHPGCVPRDAGPDLDRFRVIAPDAVARSAVQSTPGDAGVPMDEGERLSRSLSEGLARQANARAHLSERPAPRLRRQRDGSYRYETAAFDAVIAPDGTVTFSDRRADMPFPGTFTFDITDEAMRAAGQDPYVHERQWFMSETRDLRERLADEARERDRRRATRALERRLADIWGDESRAAAERRRAIFGIWDDCADDEVGAQARRIVERFVRRHLPQGSPDAYTESELAALNAGRVSPVPFAPYG